MMTMMVCHYYYCWKRRQSSLISSRQRRQAKQARAAAGDDRPLSYTILLIFLLAGSCLDLRSQSVLLHLCFADDGKGGLGRREA